MSEVKRAPDEVQAISEWLGLSASVIKSGEPWTATCNEVHYEAKAALNRLIEERRQLVDLDALEKVAREAIWRADLASKMLSKTEPEIATIVREVVDPLRAALSKPNTGGGGDA